MKKRVRAADDEMRGRLGLDPELRWSEVRRMKWGVEMEDEVGRVRNGRSIIALLQTSLNSVLSARSDTRYTVVGSSTILVYCSSDTMS